MRGKDRGKGRGLSLGVLELGKGNARRGKRIRKETARMHGKKGEGYSAY